MTDSSLNRRRFQELALTALGGIALGVQQGCTNKTPTTSQPAPTNTTPSTTASTTATAEPKGEKHLCRGLNACKEQGSSGLNDCRGQGTCATFVSHMCAGQNECKGQGGCGENPGLNDCKGKGNCSLPLMKPAWKSVRERLEKEWTAAGQSFADAPAAKS